MAVISSSVILLHSVKLRMRRDAHKCVLKDWMNSGICILVHEPSWSSRNMTICVENGSARGSSGLGLGSRKVPSRLVQPVRSNSRMYGETWMIAAMEESVSKCPPLANLAYY